VNDLVITFTNVPAGVYGLKVYVATFGLAWIGTNTVTVNLPTLTATQVASSYGGG